MNPQTSQVPTLSAKELIAVQPMSGPTDLTFKIRFTTKEEDDQFDLINPYRIYDGKWGGMGGMQQWFVFKHSSRNVYEKETRYSTDNLPEGYTGRTSYFWKRMWDDQAQCWREITPAEHELLPKLEDRLHRPIRFDKFTFPLFNFPV